jgi:outer membrane protein OmpU
MQYQRLLLGSTALVGAGFLLAGAPPAKAAGMEVKLSGYTEFEVGGATDDTYNNSGTPPNPNSNHNQKYSFFMDNEVHIEATATSDSGITYGSYLEIEIGSGPNGSAQNANVTVDEVNLFFSGNFGRAELGQQDGAEDVMFVGAEDAQSGTGGIDGDTANLAPIINLQNTGDSTKATYFTPRVAGFQLGASFSPNTSTDNGQTDAGGQQNAISAGVNWVGAFSGVDLTLSAVGIKSDGNKGGPGGKNGDVKDYSVGGVLGLGGLSFGATFGQLLDGISVTKGTGVRVGDATWWASGAIQYSFGPASASVGVDHNALDGQKDLTVFIVSADYGLLPGVTWKADVSYNTDDPGAHADNPTNTESTWAGVTSIQIDY